MQDAFSSKTLWHAVEGNLMIGNGIRQIEDASPVCVVPRQCRSVSTNALSRRNTDASVHVDVASSLARGRSSDAVFPNSVLLHQPIQGRAVDARDPGRV